MRKSRIVTDDMAYPHTSKNLEVKMKGNIYFVEKNIHGAWVVVGVIGTRQYYGYTKKEAIKRYNDEAYKTIIVEVR